jgi:two-component system nitrogen regulation response regulator NtrX
LRDRKEDVLSLVNKFLKDTSSEHETKIAKSKKKLFGLQDFQWTWNICELRNVTERLVIVRGNKLTAGDVKKYS